MSPSLHKTPISALLDHLNAWGAEKRMSRETIGDEIVTVHEAYGRELISKIVFAPNSDEPARMEANAVRIFRWLDDASKDKNLLTVNFLPSVLLAMPAERRDAWLSEYLRPLGLCVRALDDGEQAGITVHDMCEIATLDAAAMQAMSLVLESPTSEAIDIAVQKITASREKKKRVIRVLEGAKKAMAGARSFIGKIRRGEPA